MTTHDDREDNPDPRETTNTVGEFLANIIEPFTVAPPPHFKTVADTVVTVLPHAGDIHYFARLTVSRLLIRLTERRRRASRRNRKP